MTRYHWPGHWQSGTPARRPERLLVGRTSPVDVAIIISSFRIWRFLLGGPANLLSNVSIEPIFLSLDLFKGSATKHFRTSSILPRGAKFQHMNKSGRWDMTPSNVLFMNDGRILKAYIYIELIANCNRIRLPIQGRWR